MGNIIQLLPDHVANQIAAGEVVQRPASVIKELMENAVDAGATEIKVIVKDAGRSLIQVIDNGKGMSLTDARMAFERHATSKIRQTEDIFNIRTKGFRGEALASIAAVAQVETKTKPAEEQLGTLILIEGGEVKNQEPVVATTGTSIAVKNLFYNVPARRNFLKSNQVEFRHIQDEFQRVALAHADIAFQLMHNGADVYHLRAGNLKQRIVQVFGKKIETQLLKIDEDTDIVKINGFVGKPESAKKSRGEQFFFVNHRFIKNSFLHKAVIDAFEGLLPAGYTPSYFLYLEIDPSKIDINIHPTKTEIKFEEDVTIFQMLRTAIKHSLGQFNIAPSLDFDQNPNWAFLNVSKDKPIVEPKISVKPDFNPFTEPVSRPSSSLIRANLDYYKDVQAIATENSKVEALFELEDAQQLEVLQWNHRYLVVEYRGDLLIIDQHRAHQKVLYERFLQANEGHALAQQLLFPIEMEATLVNIDKIKSIEKLLISYGFDLEFEAQSIAVKAIPVDLDQNDVVGIFADFVEELDFNDVVNFDRSFAKIFAKNSAIKKGETLKKEQAIALVQQLLDLDEPNFTPYGKPVFLQFSTALIEKKLK
ncbi:DNA mismatch repair endonuclease MutL [Vaginella massiliensis]|uniref:DNA mismatch repair endonuclease MutL n=1 Tax=Vaginella massiliensis TaxID=1816680 RepID=UPI000837BCCB|nr:DNA mismatch repair endonuclease MutL [Vaginella massiliensis]